MCDPRVRSLPNNATLFCFLSTIMSARQPFVPNGGAARPASRAAANKPSFNPDRSNPLHTDKPSDTPLNLQNLMKKKPHKSGSRRDDNTKDKTLPGFPRRLQTSTPNILSPRPVLPPQSMSPLFDPKAPSPSADPKETHISASFTSTESFASPDHSKFLQSQSGSRIPSKRSRNDFEDDQEGGYPYDVAYSNAKRYRLDDDVSLPFLQSYFLTTLPRKTPNTQTATFPLAACPALSHPTTNRAPKRAHSLDIDKSKNPNMSNSPSARIIRKRSNKAAP